MTHTGHLVTGPGDDIEIDVELIGGRTLRLSADGSELGAWPAEDCHVEEDPERKGSFRIVVDGDHAVFTPSDPVTFRSLIQRLASTETMTEPDPSPEAEVATDPQSGDDATDDPVAFLFGSSPPPVPAGPSKSPDFDEPAADVVDVDAAPDHAPLVGESQPPQAFDLPDDDVVVDGGAGDGASVDLDPVAEEVDGVEASADLDPVEDVAIDEIFAADPEPDLDSESEFDSDLELDLPLADDIDDVAVDGAGVVVEPDAGGGEGIRGRFGGSALDRLSAAIGSITSNEPSGEGDQDPFELGPNTVAEDVLSTQRTLRDHQLKDAVRGKRLKIAGWVGGLVAVVALFAFLTPGAIDFIQNYEGGAEPPPPLPVSATTVPTTTVVEETDIPEPAPVTTVGGAGEVTTIFDRPAPEFVAAWDSIAEPVDEVLAFETNPVLGPFEEQFTPYLSLVGVVAPQGTVDGISLVVDPSGPANYDRVGIQALGIAIAVVDPERTPEGRAALLGELGLNVRQPDLEGIDGSVETGGIAYTLVYDQATTLLTLTVAPVS